MKRAVFSGTGIIAMMAVMQVSAWAVSMGIITGGTKGTYYQFGLNLAQLVAPAGIDLDVYPSNGSVENIFAVYKRPKTQLGIVQSDVLAFVAKVQTDPVLKRIAKKIKMVFPLYNEEIHILGRRAIADFDDLAGKRVAIGQEGSGTYLTAKLLFEVSEVNPAEQVSIGTEQALDALKKGRIDAMFYVAGYPVKLFVENVSAQDNLALVPIANKSVLDFYPHSEIPANTYAWQPQAIGTAAVKAVLVSFDFRMANCENVGRLAGILAQNMAWLKENGHPKWRSVDLNYPLKGWQQYDCVQKFLNKTPRVPKATPATLNPVLKAIKEML
jgi:TRAP transporter TAXI family solute receptor